ncbi:YkvA family protein [Phenylobacterium sp.]|uniref:YkvA family protein n=1 Tax=Phenylobacterium sp. TaxID=1871053 RepID=UPI002733E938|nr:YkvA family protein [Phenylobacterium sp.]MDP3176174.1 YkvA family protein [Phenylobacterium sp.]MDP3661177.1 YkvA family protein [Phenylobacterium sp.]
MTADTDASRDVHGDPFDATGPIAPDRALTPAVIRLNEQRVATGFWPKFRKVAARVPFAGEVLSVWFCARDAETPPAAKGMMLAALAYFVVPTDAVPDFIAGIGFTDDAAVFAALLAVVGRNLKPRHREAARSLLDRMRRET